MATTTLWHKLKSWFSDPGMAPAASGTVLRSVGPEAVPPLVEAPGWAVKSCTVYQPGQLIAGRYHVEQRFEGGMGYVYIRLVPF